MVPDAITLPNPSSKYSCYNVSNTPQIINIINKYTINSINNHRCLLALIATLRYAAPKLPNQHNAVLITEQIVYKPRHIKLFRANPIN